MSLSKPVKLADLLLGAFSALPPSETLDHLIRYLGTWSGTDKFCMIIQYSLKLLVPILHLRARIQHKFGVRKVPTSDSAARYARLASIIGDSRTLWSIWGLLPIIQWLISIERNPQPTRRLLNIERLQGWSMIGFYPLSHISHLVANDVVPTSVPSLLSVGQAQPKTVKLDSGAMGMWSCRLWAFYIILQFAHLSEDKKLLIQRQRSLKRGSKGTGLTIAEKEELAKRWDGYWTGLVVNACNLPLALHWSAEKGLIKNDTWIAILGLTSALVSFRAGWKATARPPPVPVVSEPVAIDAPAATADANEM